AWLVVAVEALVVELGPPPAPVLVLPALVFDSPLVAVSLLLGESSASSPQAARASANEMLVTERSRRRASVMAAMDRRPSVPLETATRRVTPPELPNRTAFSWCEARVGA